MAGARASCLIYPSSSCAVRHLRDSLSVSQDETQKIRDAKDLVGLLIHILPFTIPPLCSISQCITQFGFKQPGIRRVLPPCFLHQKASLAHPAEDLMLDYCHFLYIVMSQLFTCPTPPSKQLLKIVRKWGHSLVLKKKKMPVSEETKDLVEKRKMITSLCYLISTSDILVICLFSIVQLLLSLTIARTMTKHYYWLWFSHLLLFLIFKI